MRFINQGSQDVFWEKSHSLLGRHPNEYRRCSVKKGVLRNYTKFTGKHLCYTFFNKVAGLVSTFDQRQLSSLEKYPLGAILILKQIKWSNKQKTNKQRKCWVWKTYLDHHKTLCQTVTLEFSCESLTIMELSAVNFFSKSSVLDVWLRSECTSDLCSS